MNLLAFPAHFQACDALPFFHSKHTLAAFMHLIFPLFDAIHPTLALLDFRLLLEALQLAFQVLIFLSQ